MSSASSAKWQPELVLKTSAAPCNGPVTSILVSSARGKVAVCAAGCLYIREGPPSLNQKQELTAQAPIAAAAFSLKGTEVVTGGADGFLKWWQVETGEETCSTQFPLEGCSSSDLSIPHVACCKAGYVAAAAGRCDGGTWNADVGNGARAAGLARGLQHSGRPLNHVWPCSRSLQAAVHLWVWW